MYTNIFLSVTDFFFHLLWFLDTFLIFSFAFFSDHTVGIWAIKSGTDVNDNGENME